MVKGGTHVLYAESQVVLFRKLDCQGDVAYTGGIHGVRTHSTELHFVKYCNYEASRSRLTVHSPSIGGGADPSAGSSGTPQPAPFSAYSQFVYIKAAGRVSR